MDPCLVENNFVIDPDYSQLLEKYIKLCSFDALHPDISPKNFPVISRENKITEIQTLYSSEPIALLNLVQEMDKLSLRPAELIELLMLLIQHPGISLQFPLIAAGSGSKHCGDYTIPYAIERQGKRSLWLSQAAGWEVRTKEPFRPFCRFAAVTKLKS